MKGKGVKMVEQPCIEEARVFDQPLNMLTTFVFRGKPHVIVYRRAKGAGVEDEDAFVAAQLTALGAPATDFTNYRSEGHIVLVCGGDVAARAVFEMFPLDEAPKTVLCLRNLTLFSNAHPEGD